MKQYSCESDTNEEIQRISSSCETRSSCDTENTNGAMLGRRDTYVENDTCADCFFVSLLKEYTIGVDI